MIEYYLLERDNFLAYGVKVSPKIHDNSSFLGGKRITEELPPLLFEVNFPEGENLPHYLGNVVPLASKALLAALRQCGADNFQAFPAQVINPDTGQSWDDYFAFNVVGLIQAADLDKSQFDTLMGGDDKGLIMPLLAFDEIVLEKAKIDDALMFRMAESPVALVVHKSVANYLSSNKPEGEMWGLDLVEVASA